jgi:CRP-like cAMP-binding protein
MTTTTSYSRPQAVVRSPHIDARGVEEQNMLLNALPPDSYARLRPHLENRAMRVHDELWSSMQPMTHAYFPRSFVGSILIPLQSETPQVEAATVGREGFMGTPIVLGADSSVSNAIAQIGGEGATIEASRLRELIAADDRLLMQLLRYAHTLQEQIAQSVACNSRHALDERCAKWLLMTHDRVGHDEFTLLQTFLASMLGVHRPRVTVAAGMLQSAGLISYQRGTIRIVDRAGLEAASCECYAVVRAAHARMLSSSPR